MEISEVSGPLPGVVVDELAFPCRLNVSFAITGDIDVYVRRLNAAMVARGHDEIDFTGGRATPHVTLLMGEICSAMDVRQLLGAVERLSAGSASLTYRVTPPYIRSGDRGFVFLDVAPAEPFTRLRLELHSTVGRILQCETHGGPLNPSHITVGYLRDDGFDLARLHAVQVPRVAGVARVMQVAEVGNRGTCRRLVLS